MADTSTTRMINQCDGWKPKLYTFIVWKSRELSQNYVLAVNSELAISSKIHSQYELAGNNKGKSSQSILFNCSIFVRSGAFSLLSKDCILTYASQCAYVCARVVKLLVGSL